MLTNQQIETIVKRVCEWNTAAGNKAGEINYELEDNLFNEEYAEFLEAKENWDRKEGLDGVVDMIVVYIGTLYKDNTSIEYICEMVNKALTSNLVSRKTNIIFDCLQDIKPFVIDFYGACEHILDSNDSKFIQLPNGELKAIKNEAGKIQKGPNYFKPDLTPFIKKDTL